MHVNLEKALNNQTILIKKKNIRWITIPDFKIYYRTIVINTIWYWHRSRHVDKQNKTEDPNVSTCLQNHLIFDNEAKSINWRKVIIFTKRHSNLYPYTSRETWLSSLIKISLSRSWDHCRSHSKVKRPRIMGIPAPAAIPAAWPCT